MNRKKYSIAIALATVVLIASCSKKDRPGMQDAMPEDISREEMFSEKGANPDEKVISEMSNDQTTGERRTARFLYTESNDAAGNKIYIYKQNNNGTLSFSAMVASGGVGSGSGLGSQGALVLSKDHKWLFAVNAGSNSVSSFKVHSNGDLSLRHTMSSGGTLPISVTVHDNLLYVVNAGTSNIRGYKISDNGLLLHIPGSDRNLSAAVAGPAQISFSPNGKVLLVTEKATNKISSFRVNAAGAPGFGIVTASTGQTPFGFDFSRNHFMIVSNAAGGAPNASSSTSYYVNNSGYINPVNGEINNNQSAACWVATTKHGRFAFVTNTGSNTISSYYVAPFGALFLVDGDAADTEGAPTDIIVSGNNYHVYALNSSSHSISIYSRGFIGSLNSVGTLPGIPMNAAGLASF